MSLQERLTPNPAFGKGAICKAPIRPCALKDIEETCVWQWAQQWHVVLLLPKPCVELVSLSCSCFPRLLPLLQSQAIQLWRSLSCYLHLLHTNTATHLPHFLGNTRLSPTEEFHQAFFLPVRKRNLWGAQKPSNLWYTQNWTCQGARGDCVCV